MIVFMAWRLSPPAVRRRTKRGCARALIGQSLADIMDSTGLLLLLTDAYVGRKPTLQITIAEMCSA